MPMIPLPSSSDYDTPIKYASTFFERSDLKRIIPEKNNGNLIYGKGGSAIAYKTKIDGGLYAIRCFIRLDQNTAVRYREIFDFIEVCPEYFVYTEYIDNSILVNGNKYPIVKMAWANGSIIYSYVANFRKNYQTMERLIKSIEKLFLKLKSISVAHGDLSHQNIIVDENGGLKLIDYDGMYIDKLSHLDSGESGTPEFIHPKGRKYSKNMDDFSMWIIYCSLLIIQAEPAYFNDAPESLLFTAEDFRYPSTSEKLKSLRLSHSVLMQNVSHLVINICTCDSNAVPVFSQNNIEEFINKGQKSIILRPNWKDIFQENPKANSQSIRPDWKDIFPKKN